MPSRGSARSWSGWCGSGLLLALVVMALAAPWLSPRDPFAVSGQVLAAPSRDHPFGTDDLGRDVYAGVVHGAAVSLLVGVAAGALSAVIGLTTGGLAGMAGGTVDLMLMRATEFAQAVPRLFLIITLVSIFGGRLWFVVMAIGLTAWPATARLVRAQVLIIRERDFVTAARAAGAGGVAIFVRHVLPVALPVVGTHVSFQAGAAILAEAGLSFLGLGDPGVLSWGAQLGSARSFMRDAWWMAVFPGVAISLTVLACNLVADALSAADR